MTTQMVRITKGFHRGHIVSGTFRLVQPFKATPSGSFITVEAPEGADWCVSATPRIKLTKEDFQLIDSSGQDLGAEFNVEVGKGGAVEVTSNYEEVFVQSETEDEAMDRIEGTFAMLDKITGACADSIIRGLVVTGPPGIGKSFGVEKTLEAASLFRTLAGKEPKYEIVTGGVSPIGLYQKLYYNRGPDQVLVFDDCDGILFEEECLSLLKGALNSGDKRRICWNKESKVLSNNEIPEVFDFEGSVIFLSNIDFERTIARGSRISKHLEAIMSRCHYLDLEIGSTRDKLLRIKQIIRDGMLKPYNFSSDQEQSVIDFVFDNADYLRELSLRMVKKIADFVKADPENWHEMAEATTLSREAKFKRLLAKKKVADKAGAVLLDA